MNRSPLRICISVILLVISFGIAGVRPAAAKDNWTRINSRNFTLVGNAAEKDIRQVANRLEQFRAVFGLLFPTIPLTSPVPTTVIVFKNDVSFKPFKVRQTESGYFQAGEDINYIALTSEHASTTHPFHIIFHEYVHLLVNNTMGGKMPLWFNEGLAEYYSTFRIKGDDRQVLLGDLIDDHVIYLRQNAYLPLRTLFAVDHDSPYYNESNKMNIFYAESWMFMHYLLQGDGKKHRPQLATFVDLLRAGHKLDDAFQKAFEKSIEAVDNDFKKYIQASRYSATGINFEHKLDVETGMQVAPLADADAYAYLGDLLVRTRRFEDAEGQLKLALDLDANCTMAQTSFGILRVQQERAVEARPYLEKAAAANLSNYLIHYYYAFALSDLSLSQQRFVSSYSDEVAATMRRELRKAIALKPDFMRAYSLLGFVNLVRNEQIDESIELMKKATTLSVDNHRVLFMLAQLYMRKEKFADARQLLAPIIENTTDAEVRSQALAFSAAAQQAEESAARIREELKKHAIVGINDERSDKASLNGMNPDDPNAILARSLRDPRAGENRVQGMLKSIDCHDKGITFQVQAGNRSMKFHTEDFARMTFTTFTTGLTRDITCGPRKPENWIVLTYSAPKSGTKSDGEVSAIEFVPQTFVLKQ